MTANEQPSALYTARQIAIALGFDARSAHAIHRPLRAVPATATVRQRGNAATSAYSLPTLREHAPEIHAQLEEAARRDHRRSVADLIDAELRRPQRRVAGLRPREQRELARRVSVFAPLLKARGCEPLAELARKARERLAATPGKNWSIERLRKILAEAIALDAGREEWEREGLYPHADLLGVGAASVDSAAAALSRANRAHLAELPAVDAMLAEQKAAPFHRLKHSEQHQQFWSAIRSDHLTLCHEEGMDDKAARRLIVEHLVAHGSPLGWKDVPSGLRQWRKRLGAHDAAAVRGDGRASNGREAKYSLTTAEALALRRLALRKGSIPVAIEWFAQSPACTPATRELIVAELDRAARLRQRAHWPDSLRRMARPTVDEEAAFRGRKASMAVEFVERRSLEIVEEDGTRFQSGPNDVWESDDMSSNEPFTWTERAADGTTALRIGRQTLCTLDVFSARWLGVSPIGRPRDAYRAEDIADHLAECVRACGLPRYWRLERGPWENNVIDGVPVGRTADGKEIRWGGLDPIVTIVRAWKSRQKGTVEVSFNFLQTLLAHESTSIGRSRGEFEDATRLYLRANAGDAQAWAKFWSMGACADGFAAAMERFNQRPKQRRAHGKQMVVPDDLFRAAPRREVPADQWWRFLPEKRRLTVQQGHIECTSKHYPLPFRFRVNGVEEGLHLEHGYPVLIAFHPGRPEEGCHVFNAARGASNRAGWKFGERITCAPLSEDAPQINLAPHERQFHARKNANASMRAEFRAIGAVGTPTTRLSVARDGYGNSVHVGAEPATRAGRILTPRDCELASGDELLAAARVMKREMTIEEEDAELRRIEAMEAEAQRSMLML